MNITTNSLHPAISLSLLQKLFRISCFITKISETSPLEKMLSVQHQRRLISETSRSVGEWGIFSIKAVSRRCMHKPVPGRNSHTTAARNKKNEVKHNALLPNFQNAWRRIKNIVRIYERELFLSKT